MWIKLLWLQEAVGHDGAKPTQVVFLKSGKAFSCGFSRMSERQYALWDEVKDQFEFVWFTYLQVRTIH